MSNAAGPPCQQGAAGHPTPSSCAGRLPSVVTWAALFAVQDRAGPEAGAGHAHQEVQDDREDEAEVLLRVEEASARASANRAASDKRIANLGALKTQLQQAKTIVSELRGQRAAAEAQLSDMEGALAESQHAANQRLWDAAVEGRLDDIRCDAPPLAQLVCCSRCHGGERR